MIVYITFSSVTAHSSPGIQELTKLFVKVRQKIKREKCQWSSWIHWVSDGSRMVSVTGRL